MLLWLSGCIKKNLLLSRRFCFWNSFSKFLFIYYIGILNNCFDINLNFMYIITNFTNINIMFFIFCSKFFYIILIDKSHHIEEERNVKYSISHCDYLSCYSHGNEITESDGGSCDNREVECIEITRTNWISSFKKMNKKCSNKPWDEKYDRNIDEFLMMKM